MSGRRGWSGLGCAVRGPVRMGRRAVRAIPLLAALVLTGAGSARAQAPEARPDADPWLPWLGCWVPVDLAWSGTAVCFRRGPAGEVEAIYAGPDGVLDRAVVPPDGGPRPVSRDGCSGEESLRFSTNGRRLYTRASVTCAEGARRSATGVMALVTPTQWIDVRTDLQSGQPVTSVQYYQLARPEMARGLWQSDVDPAAVRESRDRASVPLDVGELADAAAHVHAGALEAWIVEQGDPFRLDGGTLLDLADAGVPDRVIDVAVAVSFPGRFNIDRAGNASRVLADQPRAGGGSGSGSWVGWGPGWPGYAYWSLYAPYGWGWPGYSGGGGYYRGYRPIYVEVTPAPPRTARVVNGKGYTQGRGGSTGSVSRSSGGSSSGVSGGGSRSSEGSYGSSSRGSESRSSTGRKAKRRGGGG